MLATLRELDYPQDRLDVKLLLEADDEETVAAAMAADVAAPCRDRARSPRRAAHQASGAGFRAPARGGELVTIFDAEDHPDPLQLRRAVAAFRRLPADVVCLQAELTFHNTDQNIITRWFTIEYLMWFKLFLPGLAAGDAPIPLGGTSNHIKRDVLESVGAWDPYNVTEDADLGIRLHRMGMRTAVLGSKTYEEANSDFVNWVKQRSRWYKGYLQTTLVHLRHPVELWRAIGASAFLQLLLFVGGTPLLALLNPLFWFLAIAWFVGKAGFVEQMFPAPLYHMAMFSWIVGNFTIWYLTMLAAAPNRAVFARVGRVPRTWLLGDDVDRGGQGGLAAHRGRRRTGRRRPTGSPTRCRSSWPLPTRRRARRAPLASSPSRLRARPSRRAAHGSQHRAPKPWHGARSRRAWSLSIRRGSGPRRSTASIGARHVSRWAGRRISVAGLLLLAFVAYLVVVTGWSADGAQRELGTQLAAAPATVHPQHGDPVARLRIPSIGLDTVVVEGADRDQLDRGPGHVVGSGLPGGRNDVVILGHRSIAGAPFADIGELARGDRIDVEAPWGQAQYRVTGVTTAGDIDHLGVRPRHMALVTSGTSMQTSDHVVIRARLVGRPVNAPDQSSQSLELPGSDTVAFPLLLAWAVAAALAWHARRWLPPRWGPLVSALVVLPLVAFATYEAFAAAANLLPATF